MSVIDRHVLGEWLKTLGLVLAALLGLLLLVDMQRNLGEFLQGDAGFGEVFYYYVVLVPGNVPMVLQVAVLLSLLYALGQLHRNSEFTALRTAGLGVLRITRSIWFFGILLAAFVGWLNASLIPWSVEEARAVSGRIKASVRTRKAEASDSGVVPSVGFANPAAGRIWFFNRYDEPTRLASGVTLGLLDGRQHEVRRLVAEEASFDPLRHNWVFRRGREMRFDPEAGELVQVRSFERQVEAGIDDDPALMLLLRKAPGDLSLFELRRALEHLKRENAAQYRHYAVEYERKKVSPFGVLVVMVLAVPFAVSGVRVNPAVNVAKSVGLFLAYYLLSRLATLLGAFGTLEPWMAAWLPDAAMLLVGFWFFARVR